MNTDKIGSVQFIKAGACSTLQDLGRTGYQHIGITDGGAADKYAFNWANYLLENNPRCACIELAMGNVKVRFTAPTYAAITGASTKVTLNGSLIKPWSRFKIDAHDELSITLPKSGVYNYLALAGGVQYTQAPNDILLNSLSTCVREHIGPNKGKPFAAGDTLKYFPKPSQEIIRSTHWNAIPDYYKPLTLRVVLNKQYHILEKNGLNDFFSRDYIIQPDSNKMGIRLSNTEPVITYENIVSKDMTSEGVLPGTIQMPTSGEPIILMAEHQTIGGYPKLGTVYRTDTFQLSQRRPGQKVRFTLGSLEDAQHELTAHMTFFEQLK